MFVDYTKSDQLSHHPSCLLCIRVVDEITCTSRFLIVCFYRKFSYCLFLQKVQLSLNLPIIWKTIISVEVTCMQFIRRSQCAKVCVICNSHCKFHLQSLSWLLVLHLIYICVYLSVNLKKCCIEHLCSISIA